MVEEDNNTSNNSTENSNTGNEDKTETVTNSDGSTTITITNTEGTTIKTTTFTDGSKTIITSKTDGSEYKTEISSDGNTTTTTEVKAPTQTITEETNNTDNTNTTTTTEEEDTKTAVEKIKGTKTYAPNEIIGQNCNIEIDGFQFVAEEITLSESYPRRNLIRTNILGGGQQTSKGEYVPRSFSFNTNINYPEGKPDEYDKLWAYINNKECNIVCQYTGDMKGEVQIQKTYPKGMGNTVKLSITVTEISQNDNTYNVKTEMGEFTTITNNSSENIKKMEDEDGNTVTVQTNISEKHTTEMSKNLKEIEETTDNDKNTEIKDTSVTTQADSTKSTSTNNTSSTNITTTNSSTKEENTNNTEEYVSQDVTVKL